VAVVGEEEEEEEELRSSVQMEAGMV